MQTEQIESTETTCSTDSTEPPSSSDKSENGKRRLTQKTNTKNKWNDWKWQMKNRIRSAEQFTNLFPNINPDIKVDLDRVAKKYPFAITPYYASLIKKMDYSDPVFKLSVPHIDELFDPTYLSSDPLHENEDMPVPGLIHRYKDRALLIVTTQCSSYCRHCTRKRVAGIKETSITNCRLQQTRLYLMEHPEITDIIVSGGDPLTLETSILEDVLFMLRQVPSIQVIRFGTRTPVVMPMRITDELVNMLKKYHPIWINTHFNHPDELTPEAIEACRKLVDAGIPLGNQSVLLRGVNDDCAVFEQLCRKLVANRVRPYYLFQCDLVKGVEHFRTRISKGIEIMEYLRGRLSGIAIPTFVVDAPNGGGKIPVLPNYVITQSPTHTVLRNFEGMLISYPEPKYDYETNSKEGNGVWGLVNGHDECIQPFDSHRLQRRETNPCTTNDML